jgi:hypothetical protein
VADKTCNVRLFDLNYVAHTTKTCAKTELQLQTFITSNPILELRAQLRVPATLTPEEENTAQIHTDCLVNPNSWPGLWLIGGNSLKVILGPNRIQITRSSRPWPVTILTELLWILLLHYVRSQSSPGWLSNHIRPTTAHSKFKNIWKKKLINYFRLLSPRATPRPISRQFTKQKELISSIAVLASGYAVLDAQ